MKKLENCINCGLCKKICPTDAISYQIKNGFNVAIIDKKKCIECNQCANICPLNKSYEKIESQEPLVLRLKDQNKINESSSGGVLGEIAREYIKKGYIIYGAKFAKDFALSHKRISKLGEINSILKSKYVQSDISQIFPSVKNDLDTDKNVIFTGTSCQIAALKQFLKKDYSNLTTIDLVCHGVPSPIIWKKYIKFLEKQEKSKIKKVDFRFNNKKEVTKNFKINFENGNKIETSLYDSNFGWAFLNNVILNNACYNCKFKNSKVLSDITLGDAHGYTNELYKNKFSLVIINTTKGKNILQSINNKFDIYKEFDMESLISNNYPILYPSLQHPNSKYILNNLDEYEKITVLPEYKENQIRYNEKNVGILNFYYENYNYGANLVAYSLSEMIKKIGYRPYIINFNPFPPFDTFEQFKTIEFVKFREKYLNLTIEYKSNEKLQETNKYINTFIVGSDQVWRKAITHNNFLTYFLDFVNWDKKCISYAASFGNDNFEGTENEKKECSILLNKFSDISVREEDAITLIKELFNQKSTLVLDPTLLLAKEDYNQLIKNENQKDINENYIAVYCLFDQNDTFKNELKRLFGNIKIVDIKSRNVEVPLLKKSFTQYRSIPEWINLIKNATYVITDSYHGLIFSIIYNKKFICLGGNSKAKSRFDTIGNILKGNINKRIIKTLEEIDNIDNIPNLNYKEINKLLEKNRKISIQYLKNALEKNITLNDYELLNKYQDYINNLKSKVVKTKTKEEVLEREKQNITKDLEETFQKYVEVSKKYDELIFREEETEKYVSELINTCLNKDIIIEKKEEIINEKEKEINDIINSKSWKLTKPLRMIKAIIRRKHGK